MGVVLEWASVLPDVTRTGGMAKLDLWKSLQIDVDALVITNIGEVLIYLMLGG